MDGRTEGHFVLEKQYSAVMVYCLLSCALRVEIYYCLFPTLGWVGFLFISGQFALCCIVFALGLGSIHLFRGSLHCVALYLHLVLVPSICFGTVCIAFTRFLFLFLFVCSLSFHSIPFHSNFHCNHTFSSVSIWMFLVDLIKRTHHVARHRTSYK